MSQNRTPGISACLDLRIQVRQTTEADVEWAISVGDRLIAAEHSTGLRPALESMQDEIAKLSEGGLTSDEIYHPLDEPRLASTRHSR